MNLTALRAFTRFLTNTNSTTYSDTDLDASLNSHNEIFTTEILDAMDDWDFSADTAVADLVANQQEYTLPTDILKIKRVEISYDGTTWYPVSPMDVNERGQATDSTSISGDFSTSSPFFDLMDESMFLYPTPTANSTGGLKIWYEKEPVTITGSLSPAFVSSFHKGLCYGAAEDFFDKYPTKGDSSKMESKKENYINRMKIFYRKRNQDRKYTIEGAYADYGYGNG